MKVVKKMIYIGIDVAKDKHDCIIVNSEGSTLFKPFTILNNKDGFDELNKNISSLKVKKDKIKVGLEATGHYSYNILGYLINKGYTTYVINPLHTNLYRKAQTLRKTKTDKLDCSYIAQMLMSDVDLKPYSHSLYHNEQLKSLSRYRFDKVAQRSKLKQSISRICTIQFPELEKIVSTLHCSSVYALLTEYPSAKDISKANLTKLTNILSKASRGRFTKEKAKLIRDTAKKSIGSTFSSNSLELKHTIESIQNIDSQIKEIETEIEKIMNEINSPITSIPGIGLVSGALILSEIGDFSRFSSPDKILAFAGLSPTTHQSGEMYSTHAKMEKRGSKYLRYALYNAAKFVCQWEPTFNKYLDKKRKEGKHYNVAISHAAKKLVRVIFHLQKTNQLYAQQP